MLAKIVENFEYLDDWEDRYRYLIELGRDLPAMNPADQVEANKVKGCASQVWLKTKVSPDAQPILTFEGDSDAHIVRGLVALIIAFYSGKTATDILKSDALELFGRLGLAAHLTPQRSNGVRSMIERIKSDALKALASEKRGLTP